MSVTKEDSLASRRSTARWVEISLAVVLIAVCAVGIYYAFR